MVESYRLPSAERCAGDGSMQPSDPGDKTLVPPQLLPSVCLMMFSNSSGYLVRRCISEMIKSFSCRRRHCGLLSAS